MSYNIIQTYMWSTAVFGAVEELEYYVPANIADNI